MQINALFLADKAEVTNDRLSVQDAVWDGLDASAWPASHPIKVVLVLVPTQEDVGRTHAARVDIAAPDGSAAGSVSAEVQVHALREQVPVVLPVRGRFSGPGRYRVSVSVGEAHAQVAFLVRGPALGALPGLGD